ncbi:hypothetical protein SO802_013286 [Lithocarpus litseifolius]|uniref:Chitinase n=1 Tax=Lithocarpus litseifolius TaxID=425828 RepID=A0AAW2D950_9ROSI
MTLSPKQLLCKPLKLVPFLAVFFKSSAITSDGITIFTAFDEENDVFFSMNFFTIVAKLGFEGLDLVWEDRSDGLEDLTTSAFEEDEEFGLSCLFSCSVDEDESEK